MSRAIEKYSHLTNGGKREVALTQEEECAILFVHDYGVLVLSEQDTEALYSAIGKLKDQIWP